MTTTLVDRAALEAAYDRHILGSDFFEGGEYYRLYRDRYLNTFRLIEKLLPRGGRLLDIGSGQFAMLAKNLLDARADVADIDTRFTADLQRNGIGFVKVDLSREQLPAGDQYDLIVMAEVIEHVPTPPHIVFANLKAAMKPGGALLVTTPNFYRFRNLVRMITGRPVLDKFVYPQANRGIGHFTEYALDHLAWHVREAGLTVEQALLTQLSWSGRTVRARAARRMLAPLLAIRPLWRDNLVIVARNPA